MATVASEKEVDMEMTSLFRRYARTVIFIMIVIAFELALLIERNWTP